MRKYIFMMIGFLAGATYIVGCGGSGASSTMAAILGAAVDVTYSNSSSGLSATDTQTAIDELATMVAPLDQQGKIGAALAADLVGSWTGTYCASGNCNDISMTLNADGSFDCDTGSNFSAFGTMCDDPNATWSVLTRVLQVSYNSGSVEYYNMSYASATILEMSEGVQHVHSFTKNE